jgi:hypothetical protein
MNPADLPLRDLHLPQPVGWWPLAPGWWWVIGLVLLLIVIGLAVVMRQRYRRARLGYWIRPEFLAIKRQYQRDGDALVLLQSVSALLRRACISLYPREDAAGLTSDAWLSLLDHTGQTRLFSDGPGRLLAQSPYEKTVSPAQVDQLLPLLEDWIKHCSAKKLRRAES